MEKLLHCIKCVRPCSSVPNTKHVDCVVIMVKEQYYSAMEPAPNIKSFSFITKKQKKLCAGPMNAGFNQRMTKKQGNYYKGNEVVLQEKISRIVTS